MLYILFLIKKLKINSLNNIYNKLNALFLSIIHAY